ncbi:MAG: SDR family oxidoreductase [Candidatus Omnitrophota bacterium]|nr:SDR family oxidoreductase [Candidatus Omnitrophota bacterium]MDZ4241528.1 SDR family oxidoreductase [Candidatus Omnitrophota bacterium]
MPAHPPYKGTALVTGAARRIGKTLALALSRWGYRVALHCNRSHKDAGAVAREIKKEGGDCEIFAFDLADAGKVQALFKAVTRRFPDLNILINNASIFEKSSLRKPDLGNFDRHFAVNLRAPYILTSLFASSCKKGHIINILDAHIVRDRTAHAAYLLSKKGLNELTRMSAYALAPDIRVNGIAPGLILPPEGEGQNYLDRLAKDIPLKRKGDLANIVRSLQFLLENDDLTGQIIFSDGGEHLE